MLHTMATGVPTAALAQETEAREENCEGSRAIRQEIADQWQTRLVWATGQSVSQLPTR